MEQRYRTHTCGELSTGDIGLTVRLSGWVNRVRDHGGLLFIDLRDHYGITQIVVSPDSDAFVISQSLRPEWVVQIVGEVKSRTDETVNQNLKTGRIEVFAGVIKVLSPASELPMPVFGEPEYPEDIRLKYRFLDLRRPSMHRNMMLRSKIVTSVRRRMLEVGFEEYSTPILTASSPEGARDFLVPSRVHPGKFFALPQAPQQYKQLLMIAGFDRYFQIAPCFRDEDPRADRLPGEFYQLDLEMNFVDQNDVLRVMEPVLRGIFEEFADGERVTRDFLRISYDVAMRKYASDKPDLRNPVELQEVTQHFAGSGFSLFANMIDRNPEVEVWAVPARGGGSRAFCDRMDNWAKKNGHPGLGYIMWKGDEENGSGPIAKNIGVERTRAIRSQLCLGSDDACLFIAGKPDDFVDFADDVRTEVAEQLGLIDKDQFALCWIVDFPLYKWNAENAQITFSHNPFSMPQGGLDALETQDPLSIKAWQYDLVCNGSEIASGSIRNNSLGGMVKAFEIAGLSQEDVRIQFTGLYKALQYGAPPHGGLAAGLDRIVMLLLREKSLRNVTLFPMNQQASDPLMNAPSFITSPQQLSELHIRVEEVL